MLGERLRIELATLRRLSYAVAVHSSGVGAHGPRLAETVEWRIMAARDAHRHGATVEMLADWSGWERDHPDRSAAEKEVRRWISDDPPPTELTGRL